MFEGLSCVWSRLYGFAIYTALLAFPLTAHSQDSKDAADPWRLQLRYRTETSPGSGRFHTLTKDESWDPKRTAIIVCDVWDAHHSINAVRRVEELAPRIDQVLKQARQAGATIVHSPSDCMESYTEHPSRKRAQSAPAAAKMPAGMDAWCHRIDSEKAFAYPLDQSDGGEDDDPAEHTLWANELRARGRNPSNPWLFESPLIEIDENLDFISDKGEEVWNILESRGIENVVLVGVHTNMCVLGRPFGLRNMVAAGKRVAFARDLTDTMYNPQSWPFVNHHTGTDLIVEYIEKCICPTISSEQLVGGRPFRFKSDNRPLVAIVMAEDEYETNQTLPQFAARYLGQDFRVALLYASDENPNNIPGLEVLDQADAAIISVRRRPLPKEQIEIIRHFADSAKPLIGIRTASHAFALRDAAPPEPLVAWPEFDSQVWGGNYSGHHGNELLPKIELVSESAGHPILTGISQEPGTSGGSLYKTSPLARGTEILWRGSIVDQPAEPVAWTFQRAGGGKSFYTSLGHKEDFENPAFTRMLFNSLVWATGIGPRDLPTNPLVRDSADNMWKVVEMPFELPPSIPSSGDKGDCWFRCFIKLGQAAAKVRIELTIDDCPDATVWLNGKQLSFSASKDGAKAAQVPAGLVEFGELNLLAIRWGHDPEKAALVSAPVLAVGEREYELAGKWQFRFGLDPSFASLKLPPKFGAAPDVIFDWSKADSK